MLVWRLGVPKSLQRFWGDQWQTTGLKVLCVNGTNNLDFQLPYNLICWCGGMADAQDLKS